MESSTPTTVTGSHGTYHWLATGLHDLDSFLLRCPETLPGKYVAVTSLDSGPLRLTEEQERTGWRSRGGVAYSPQVRIVEKLRRGGSTSDTSSILQRNLDGYGKAMSSRYLQSRTTSPFS